MGSSSHLLSLHHSFKIQSPVGPMGTRWVGWDRELVTCLNILPSFQIRKEGIPQRMLLPVKERRCSVAKATYVHCIQGRERGQEVIAHRIKM